MHIHFDHHTETQLKGLAAKIGKAEDFCVIQAVKNYLEDVEDIAKAEQILLQNNRKWTQEEVERELGFDFSPRKH